MYTRVLIPVDGSTSSEHAAQFGLTLAKQLAFSVVFVHVLNPQDFWVPSEVSLRNKASAQMLLEQWEHRAIQQQLKVDIALEEHPDIAKALLKVGQQAGCDLIVMGSHGHTGLSKVLLGNVAERVARMTQVPVLLIRPDTLISERFQHVLLATDGSPCSQLALQHADALAQHFNAKLTLLNVAVDISQFPVGLGRFYRYTNPQTVQTYLDTHHLRTQGRQLLEQSHQACRSQQVHTLLKEATQALISEVICDVATQIEASLIVTGTHGYQGSSKYSLGSVAGEIAHKAKQPVLLVPNPQTHH